MLKTLSIAIAGSTERSKLCATALHTDSRFSIPWIVTPAAKPIGRKQVVTQNPLASFAEQQNITTISIETKFTETIRENITQAGIPDILLVVDFGYFVPQWLLSLPKLAPINIHPSYLPRWRGSSPGQFVLLYGDPESAVSLIIMNELLDQGEILMQLPFPVNQQWTTTEYYQHSFELVCSNLAEILLDFAGGKLHVQAQPLASPTVTAARLSKADSFVPWELLQQAVQTSVSIPFKNHPSVSTVLADAWKSNDSLQVTLEHAVRAFSPWPKLWTVYPSNGTEKRLQFISASMENGKFLPKEILIEGKQVQNWTDLHF